MRKNGTIDENELEVDGGEYNGQIKETPQQIAVKGRFILKHN